MNKRSQEGDFYVSSQEITSAFSEKTPRKFKVQSHLLFCGSGVKKTNSIYTVKSRSRNPQIEPQILKPQKQICFV